MIKLKCYDKYSEDGYFYPEFNTYEEFTKWFIDNYKFFEIMEIKDTINIGISTF